MAAKEIAKDKYICTEGQSLDAIHIIASGSVKAAFEGGSVILKKGDIVGLADLAYDSHYFNYSTLETSSFISFPLKAGITEIAKANPEVGKMMYTSMLNQLFLLLGKFTENKNSCAELYKRITEGYDTYVELCRSTNTISRSLPKLDSLSAYTPEEEYPDWIVPYYATMREFSPELKHTLSTQLPYLYGFLKRASLDIHNTFASMNEMNDYLSGNAGALLSEGGMDIFELYTSLLYRQHAGSPEADKIMSILDEMINYLSNVPFISKELLDARVEEYHSRIATMAQPGSVEKKVTTQASIEELKDSLDTILDYAAVTPDDANEFKRLIMQYKKLSDKASTEDGPRKLRLEITKRFYEIYKEAFFVSTRDYDIPTVLKMFFNFGYMDEELAGEENAAYLFRLAEDLKGDPTSGVYTAHEWLKAIYDGKKDPSRNEFDTDYLTFLHEQKVQGKLSADDEKRMASDPTERVLFELNNMFPMVNKVTYGRLSIFCPVFSEHNIIKPLPSCLVNIDTIVETLHTIDSIDFGAFYRETIYVNDAAGVSKEFIAVKVIPDVILMPNVGTRGVMWQEIEGRKRTTPARFLISVFHLEDIVTTFTRLVGEYRWEMCKRIQGARWNDVSDRSLTSEYFDYVQFYRKNSELSQDAKEKIKTSLTKAKNSFKEMFVRDYIIWVLYEGAGSPRHNKVVRQIMCTYCPFPYELRNKLTANPLFKDILERYNVKTTQKLHHFDNVIQKIKNAGQEIPNELLVHRNYIEGK